MSNNGKNGYVFGEVLVTTDWVADHVDDPNVQGCSVLKNSDIIEDIVKVHTVLEEFKTNIFDLVFAQDVEGKTSQFGKDMRMSPNPRFVFAHRHIPPMVISIFNAPMIADGLTKLWGTQDKG